MFRGLEGDEIHTFSLFIGLNDLGGRCMRCVSESTKQLGLLKHTDTTCNEPDY